MYKNLPSLIFPFFFLLLFINTATAAVGLGVGGSYRSNISPALKMILDKNEKQGRYKESIAIIDNELRRDPNNVTLLYSKAGFYADEGDYENAIIVLNRILTLQPNHQKARQLLCLMQAKWAQIPRNELGFSQDEIYVSDLRSYWSYSSLHYYRFTSFGTFGARVNYANRFAQGGEQYVLEAYPKLTKNFYITLIYGWSNTSQRVFPRNVYTIEPYFSLPCGVEASLGQRYLRDFSKNIYIYTGSIGINIRDYFVWFRPYHYVPKGSNYFELGLRRIFCDDKDTYIQIKVGTGRYVDIGDVPPFNEIVGLKADAISLSGQMPIRKNIYIQAGAGYTHQIYDTGLHRNLTDGNVGIIWRF